MFFNVIATLGLGQKQDILQQNKCFYGQAKLSIDVNPLNGNLFVSDFNKTFTESGFQFNIGYQYNSQASVPWRLNQGKVIGPVQGEPNEAGSFVVVEEADGHKSTYRYDTKRQSYVNTSEAGGSSILTLTAGKWTGWNPASDTRETYNQNNQLQQVSDVSGNHLNYSYDSEGRLTGIGGKSGNAVSIEYQNKSTSIYFVDGDKKTLIAHYEFDEKNQIKTTSIPVNEQESYEIHYGYSERTGLLAHISQSDETRLDFDYSGNRLTSLANGTGNEFRLDYNDNVSQIIDPTGVQRFFIVNQDGLLQHYAHNEQHQEFRYDELNRIKSVDYQDDTTKQFHYDELGFHAEITGRSQEKVLYHRDKLTGLLLCATEVDGDRQHNTFYTYNDKHELTFKVLPNGAVHAYAYDSHGNCIRETVYLYAFFDLSSLTYESRLSTQTIANWCAQQNPVDISLTEWIYNSCGQKTSQTRYAHIDTEGKGIHDAFTAYSEFEWNVHGELCTEKTKLNEEETAVTSLKYDALSRLSEERDALGQLTLHSYQKNQHQSTFVPTGLVSTKSCNPSGAVTQREEQCGESVNKSNIIYDSAGRCCIIEKDGCTKEYIVYDKYDRVLYRIDSLLNVTEYSYDSNNYLTHELRYANPLTSVDENALKQGLWHPEVAGDCCIDTKIHSANGNVLFTINGDNFVTVNHYDSMGNHIETIEYATALELSVGERLALTVLPEIIEEPLKDRRHRYFYNDANQLIGEQLPLGQVIAYELNAKGELLKQTTTLAPLPVMTYWDAALIADAGQKVETFKRDARGQCLQYVDAENIVRLKTWDAGGRIIESSHGGETKQSVWDPLNRLIKKSYSSGLERTKTYAPCGHLASDIKVDTITESQPRVNLIRYNGFGQITHELTPRAALKLNDPAFAQDPYLAESLWENESIRHTYNSNGLKVSSRDELGNITYFYYNNARELCFTINPSGSITEDTYDSIFHKCNSTRTYKNCLDEGQLASLEGGLLTSEMIQLFHQLRTEEDAVQSVQFNKRGLTSLEVDAEQFVSQKHYDAFKNIIRLQQQIDERNELVTCTEYDKANRTITKIEDVDGIAATEVWHYKDEENAVEYTDANRNVHITYNDKLGRKIKERNALGLEATFVWDALSRLVETTDRAGNKTSYVYEFHGRKITRTSTQSHSTAEKNAFGEITSERNSDGELRQKIYDPDAQVGIEIDPDGHQYVYKYNQAGWLIEVIDPLNKITHYQHDKNGQIERQIEVGLNEERVITFKRDTVGREILRIDAEGIITQTIYDKRGLIVAKIIDPEGLALGNYHQYNGLGLPVEEMKGSSEYPNQFKTRMVYDKSGREIQRIIDPDGLQLTIAMTYDLAGNCIAIRDSNNHTTHFCFDSANRERYVIDPMGGVKGKIYDANGNCIEEREYSLPLKIDELNDFALAHIETLLCPTEDDKVHYQAYDTENRCIASLDSKGKFSQYSYNAEGNKTSEISFATPVTPADFMKKIPAANPKDRSFAWFYDKCGNERFAINGEGIVSEQRWNEKGWLIEERIYASPCFDFEHCPDSHVLEEQDYRSTHYIHDVFGRVVFEIDGEGYVTEYGYSKGDKPETNWFYPEKISIPGILNLSTIRELLPVKDLIPCTHIKYDAAGRKVKEIDQLKYGEEFKLDALDNLREYIDKGGDSWLFDIDAAGRKIAESTPPVELSSVSKDGKLISSSEKQRVIKKIEYAGDVEYITEGYGTKDARTLEVHRNPCNQITKTVHQGVTVHDKAAAPLLIIDEYASDSDEFKQDNTVSLRPEHIKVLTTQSIYNCFQKPVVLVDEIGNLKFKIYQADQLLYEIDQEGFVTAFEYDVFGNVSLLTRYEKAIELDFTAFATTGIPLATVLKELQSSELDRHIFREFDNANRQIKTSQDAVLSYISHKDSAPEYGESVPVKINQYNAFGEIHTELELVNPFSEQWHTIHRWTNKAGYVIAQIDSLHYLTLFEPDRHGNNKRIIEYAKPLQLSLIETRTIQEVVQAIEVDEENDREYSNETNARGEVVKSIQHRVRLYDDEVDVSIIDNPVLVSARQDLKHEYSYNAKGNPIKSLLPNGGCELTVYDARNLPVLKTKPARFLETGKATPVVTMGYNAFGQPVRVTHHKNPYENKAYLIASKEDQTQLTGFDVRGMQIVAVDPEGAVHFQSFTETKKIASSWIWVKGWGANGKLIQRLHQSNFVHDKRGIETLRCEAIEGGASVVTATRSNAFGEKIGEGDGSGEYPVYWLRDRTGAVWNTNEQSGVAVITLRDARGHETLSLRSRTRSLNEVTTLEALKEVLALDYQHVQRLELQRDLNGNVEAQMLPAFKTLKADAPEPYYTEVSCGRAYPAFGKISLSWPVPDIAGLEAELLVWSKGREDARQSLAIIVNDNRCGADVSALPLGDYQYQIDFYYRDPQENQREGLPRYRAEGGACILSDIIPTDNLFCRQTDEQHLMLYGDLGDVSGIELMLNGVSAGRVSVSSTDTPNCWMVDLSDKPSGRYDYHLLRGYSLLEEQPLKIGEVSEKGTRIDVVTTHLSQTSNLVIDTLNAVVTTTWDNLPPQISNLYQELTMINSYSPDIRISLLTNYVTPNPQIISLDSKHQGRTQLNNYHNLRKGLESFVMQFSSTISRNRLFTIDKNNQQLTLVDSVNNSGSSSFLYVQPSPDSHGAYALREHFSDGRLGKNIALSQWMNQSSRCVSSLVNKNTSYDLISLHTSVVDPVSSGSITIHTANMQSKRLIVREIALTKTSVSKVKSNYSGRAYYPAYERNALNFNWSLPGFLANSPIKVNVQLRMNNAIYKKRYGDTYTFDYIVGKANYTPYNGPLLIFPKGIKSAFSDFDLNYLNMYVQYNGDWIPLLHSQSFTVNRAVSSKPSNTVMSISKGPKTWAEVISSYIEGDVANFQDTYNLLFYPLPSGICKFELEYSDISLPTPTWRPLANTQYTGHAIVAPAGALNPGTYQFRIKAKNVKEEFVDLSELVDQSDNGWAIGTFDVTHGGTLTTVYRTEPYQEVLRPKHEQIFDRWGNLICSTNGSMQTISMLYNGINKLLKKTEPQIEITEANGLQRIIAPQTNMIYNLGGHVIAVSDANQHIIRHERDYDGKALKTILADGVFKRFIPDIFGRTIKMVDPFIHSVHYGYDRCNRELSREDECHWKTLFDFNEYGDRLRVTRGPSANGRIEQERFDYLHPSRKVTHHFLPGGDTYRTIKDYNRHGVMTLEELSDHRQNTWVTDEFGNVLSHKDLGGVLYEYTLNPFYPTEVRKQSCINAHLHGSRMEDNSTKPMPNQHIIYQYDEASHLVSILDNALPLTTLYRYDIEERRARETFLASDGHIHQAVLMKWNSLGWLVEVQDTVVKVKYSQDAKGNRRSTEAKIFWDGIWRDASPKSWFTYTDSDCVRINQGVLLKGVIQIAPGVGTQLIYDLGGRRNHELTIEPNGERINKSLFYLDNNLLTRIENTRANPIDFTYDGQIARRRLMMTKVICQQNEYSPNGWISCETYRDESKNVSSSTTYSPNMIGAPTHQTTIVRSIQDETIDGYTDEIDFMYVGYDADKISAVNGLRTRVEGGSVESSVNTSYDPNGNLEAVVGVGTNQEPRHFITNSQNRIVKKTIGQLMEEFYFYTTYGAPLARFGNIPPEAMGRSLTNVNFNLGYHPFGEHFPAPAPNTHVVITGDTFSSISEGMYGDSSFASLIADANGYHQEDIPPVGLTLQIPSVDTSIHNWEGKYPIYNPAAIIGSLYPNMPIPLRKIVPQTTQQKHSHKKFWHVMVEAIVGTAILAFAPELSGLFSTVVSEFLGEVFGYALAGAASNFVQQELAIQLGDQSKFSLHALGQSTLLSMGSVGIANRLGLGALNPKEMSLLDSAVKNIELTIATQGLSFATGQQRHFDWRVMLASLSNTLANVGAKQINLGGPKFNTAVATSSATVASIGVNEIYGTHMCTDEIVANALGSFIGNQLAAQAKQHYAQYQEKRAAAAELQRSMIPEISDTLASSERSFIQSVLANPHAHGKAPSALSTTSAPTPQRRGHHASPTHAQKDSHLQNRSPSAHKASPQQHLLAERNREEQMITQTSRHNSEQSRTKSQPRASQHGFWSSRNKSNNSNASTPGSIFNKKNFISDLVGEKYVERETSDIKSAYSGAGLFMDKNNPAHYPIDYNKLFATKGKSYSTVIKKSHYYKSPGSPIAGDASKELQMQSIEATILAAKNANLTLRETAYVLALVQVESGFNPYAAAGTTTAAGLGQFIDDTWRLYFPELRRWDIKSQTQALVSYFKKNQEAVKLHFLINDEYVYKFYHDGPRSTPGYGEGLDISQRRVYPKIDTISEVIKSRF
jgi:YD repeat-containing protein